jgi:hypothetical protein
MLLELQSSTREGLRSTDNMTDPLRDLVLNDIIREKEMVQILDQRDAKTREFYLGLKDPSLRFFESLLRLNSELTLAIAADIPSFSPKFPKATPIQTVLARSAAGCLRELWVARKLLLDGYVLEMHATMRMIIEWLQFAVFVEQYPETAETILEHGMKYMSKYRNRLLRSRTELATKIYKPMRIGRESTYDKLSQRVHAFRRAMDLTARPDGAILFAGVCSEEMFPKEALALAGMAHNALTILMRHFQKVPKQWNDELQETYRRMEQRRLDLQSKD